MADVLAALRESLNELVIKITGDLLCFLVRSVRLIFLENEDIAYRATSRGSIDDRYVLVLAVEVLEELFSRLAGDHFRSRNVLQALVVGLCVPDGVEEEDEGLGGRHCTDLADVRSYHCWPM